MLNYRKTELYKYNIIVAELRKKILFGDFGKNRRLPPERKLAEIFDVSRITIRSAIKQLKLENIIEQTHGRGTFVKNLTSTQLSNGENPLKISCVCLDAHSSIEEDPYYSQIFLGFYRAAAKTGCEFSTIQIPEKEKISDGLLANRKYDGFIFINYILDDQEIKYLNDLNIKFVQLGESKSPRRIPTVDIDNFSGIYQAVYHLIETGKTKPLLLYKKSAAIPMRLAGYDAAMRENGLELESRLRQNIEGETPEAVVTQLNGLIKQKLAFDSIIVIGDWATVGAINCLKKKKIKIPEDVSVITHDSFQWILSGIKPRLTSISQPFAKMSEIAVYMLQDLIDSPNDEIPIKILKPKLLIAESTIIKE